MSERLTSAWTPDAAGAFGASGVKGDKGEQFLCEVFEAWGWEYELHSASREHQLKGIDITFRNPNWNNSYTADIKANLDQYGSFFIETNDKGWLFNPSKANHRVWHLNPETGWMAWYDRREMQQYIATQGLRNTGLLKITVHDKLDIITRKRHNISRPSTEGVAND